MSQTETVDTAVRLEPNLKVFSESEREAVIDRVMSLFEEGKDAEAEDLHRTLPLPAEILQILKEYMGLDALIEENVNLSTAVEKYGKEWLYS